MKWEYIAVIGFVIAVTSACMRSSSALDKFERRQDRLIRMYIVSDYDGARAALHTLLAHIENSAQYPMDGVNFDDVRWPVEGRLALMYEDAGDIEKANQHLIQATSHYNVANRKQNMDQEGMRRLILQLEKKTMPKWRMSMSEGL